MKRNLSPLQWHGLIVFSFLLSFFGFKDSSLNAQPANLPWEPDSVCNSIITTGIVAVTCGTTAPVAPAERYTFGMIDINGALPAAGRIDVSSQQAAYHHPAWHIDSIGNVFGITMDYCGNTYLTASSNYASRFFFNESIIRYGEIGGGANDLEAAGTVYKIEGTSGQPVVFAVLPQQAASFQHRGCEGDDPIVRFTGPALGNIVFSPSTKQFYVSNFEDGRIYRLDNEGNILDSYDPFNYDTGAPGTPALNELAYGLDVFPDGTQLFFGTSGGTFANLPGIYSISLNPDGSFSGTINNTSLPAGSDWDNYVGTEQLHYTISQDIITAFQDVLSFSDMEFTPSGDLLVGVRVGCFSSIHSSYNHGGMSLLLESAGGVYSNLEGVIYTGCNFCGLGGGNECYGGVSVFENPNGTVEFVVSSADLLGDAEGPHGISIQEEGVFGSPFEPASPAGLISYGTVDDNNFDPKGVGGDVKVFSACDCIVTCPTEITAVAPSQVCSGSGFDLSITLTGGNAMMEVVWSDEGGNAVDPESVVLQNGNCAPETTVFTATATCAEDTTVVLTDEVEVSVFTNDVTPFITMTAEACEVNLVIDPSCTDFFSVEGEIPVISPGDTGTVVLEVASVDSQQCASESFELSYACPECLIDSLVAVLQPCTDSFYTVELNFNPMLTGESFSVTDQFGNNYGTFNYSELPVIIGPLLGDSVTVYQLTVQDLTNELCNATVEVGPQDCCGDFEMPNVFTPNNDSHNDEFWIVHTGAVTVLEFQIFNRFGQLVHETPEPWDGKFKKEPHPQDVFIFRIVVDTGCELVERIGDVTLLR